MTKAELAKYSDHDLLVRVNQLLEDHLDNHNRSDTWLRWGITTLVAVTTIALAGWLGR